MERTTDWRDFLPAMLVLAIAIIAPYLLPMGLRDVAPPLAFGVIFYFLRQRVQPMISIWVIIIAGLLLDVQQAMPLGVGISAAILLYWVAHLRDERKETLNVPLHFLRYCWVSAIVMGWIYGVICLREAQLYPLSAVVMQWVVVIVSYPLIYGLCHAIHRQMHFNQSHSL